MIIPKKETDWAGFACSLRGQLIISQALIIAIRELKKVPSPYTEKSNILDMEDLHRHVFPLYDEELLSIEGFLKHEMEGKTVDSTENEEVDCLSALVALVNGIPEEYDDKHTKGLLEAAQSVITANLNKRRTLSAIEHNHIEKETTNEQ